MVQIVKSRNTRFGFMTRIEPALDHQILSLKTILNMNGVRQGIQMTLNKKSNPESWKSHPESGATVHSDEDLDSSDSNTRHLILIHLIHLII